MAADNSSRDGLGNVDTANDLGCLLVKSLQVVQRAILLKRRRTNSGPERMLHEGRLGWVKESLRVQRAVLQIHVLTVDVTCSFCGGFAL